MGRYFGVIVIAVAAVAAAMRADDQSDLAAAKAAVDAGDFAKAVPIIEAMAARGSAEGLRAQAVLYLRGQGVAKDEPKAFALMTKAAEAGLPAVQHELAILLYNGVVAPKDLAKASEWLKKAGAQNVGVSWHLLGRIAAEGKNLKDAAENYRKASKFGVIGAMLDLAQTLMNQVAETKADGIEELSEAYRWVQTALAAVPSGPQRDEVHRIRLAIEDGINKRDPKGAATTI
ncbi:MAG: sel1 repeat family protein, partial [Alphaproteobacteria bacterium]|nr:sel1 repeat family protein [Alphaproteobacteria bacterium]